MNTSKRQLLSIIEELLQIIHDDLSQMPALQKIIQDLSAIRSDLESERLNVYIFSTDLKLAQVFYGLLTSHQHLEKFYHFEFQALPKPSLSQKNTSPLAFLVLQELSAVETRSVRYALSVKPILKVGRKPGCDILIPDHYTGVSGYHLEISCAAPEGNDIIPQWRIQNCHTCRNGTYINGHPLSNSHILKSGDRLVLGHEFPTAKSPALVFESQSSLDETFSQNDATRNLHEFINCDSLILVMDSQREHLQEEKELLKRVNLLPANNIFQVILSGKDTQDITIFHHTGSSVEMKTLCLEMGSISDREINLLKVQRAWVHILDYVERISQLLLKHQENLNQMIKQIGSQSMQENCSGDVTAILKVIKEQKDNFSKAIEAALSQSKHDLLDDSLADSIHQKICDAVNKLEIHILKQDGKKYLELRPDGIDVNANDFIISFCKQELVEWAEEEWRKISRYYGSGGLEGLVKNTNVTLKTVNEYNSESLALRLRSEIECEGIFQLSLRRIPCHTDYHEDPIWIYFIKKIRSSVFQVMGILFLLSFLGVSRGSFIKQINKQIANSPFLLLLVSGITTWLLYKLYKTYRNDKEIEAQKIAEKVRKELRDYYQKITKNRFMDRIVQILELNLREEIMRLDEAVKSFLQTSQTRKATIRDNQLFLQGNLKQYQDEVKKFDRKLREIQRIKDKLQRHRPGNDTPILF